LNARLFVAPDAGVEDNGLVEVGAGVNPGEELIAAFNVVIDPMVIVADVIPEELVDPGPYFIADDDNQSEPDGEPSPSEGYASEPDDYINPLVSSDEE
jgi:hypothetical protein